jgi:hypothetical protein
MYLLTSDTMNELATTIPESPSEAAKNLVIPNGARSPYPIVVKVMHEKYSASEEMEGQRWRRDGGTAYLMQQFWEIRIGSPYLLRTQTKPQPSTQRGFVSGHDFSRAVNAPADEGFSPWGKAGEKQDRPEMTPEETKKLHWSKRQNDTFPLGHFRLSYFSLRNAALSASQTLAGNYSTSY